MAHDLTAAWRALAPVDIELLSNARIAAHFAVQWLGRFGRACVPPTADDSHTALTWDTQHRALVSGAAQTADGPARIGFSFGDFALSVHKGETVAATLPLDGMSDAEIGAWLAGGLAAMGLRAPLEAPLPYEMPDSPLAEGAAYASNPISAALSHLETLYDNAAAVIEAVRDTDERALPLRCWPHHFDIASLIAIDAQTSEDARSIGVGLSPGDETYAAPYFYVTPWPYPAAERLTALPTGHWHTEGFVGAILKMPDVLDHTDQAGAVSDFLTASLVQSAALLGDKG